MGSRAQNKIESHQILLSNALGNEAKRNAENEQDRERIAMDRSCHEHARKPQPEDEFHLPGKVTKIDFMMYSWHNLDNIRCKIRGKSMENMQ